MKKIILTAISIMLCCGAFANDIKNLSADAAFQKLKQGNERFVKMHLKHPDTTKHRREELIKGQHPFVAILSCSDSRVPTEIIFDQGMGDIFAIRNAGNVVDEHILGSIEYAMLHLGVKLIVVLGHESCGAVGAAMYGGTETPAIESIKKSIEPACAKCKKENKYTYEEVIKTHTKLTVDELLKDKKISEYVKTHNVKILPAYYKLSDGKVYFLE